MTSEYPSKTDMNASSNDAASDSNTASTSGLSSQTKTTRAPKKSRKAADAFKTISEVAKALDVQQHVLRFWETKFSYVKPLKRGGGRRYYRPEDFALLEAIHHMLYTEGYTIKGVQKILREKGKNSLIDMASGDDDISTPPTEQKPLLAQRPQSLLATQDQSESARPFSSTPILKRSDLNSEQKQALRTVLQELKDIRGLMKLDTAQDAN